MDSREKMELKSALLQEAKEDLVDGLVRLIGYYRAEASNGWNNGEVREAYARVARELESLTL